MIFQISEPQAGFFAYMRTVNYQNRVLSTLFYTFCGLGFSLGGSISISHGSLKRVS